MKLIKKFHLFRIYANLYEDKDEIDYFIIFLLSKHSKRCIINFYKWNTEIIWTVKNYMIKSYQIISGEKYLTYTKNEKYKDEKCLTICVPGFDKKLITVFKI
jgi:hypothetical protein